MPAKSRPVLRLYVYIRVAKMPPGVEIDFPDEALAKRYWSSIQKTKKGTGQKRTCVCIELPSSVTDIESNRSLEGFILHFRSEEGAAEWKDTICNPVKGHPRQLSIRQYWDDAGLAKLERELPALTTPATNDNVRSEVAPPTVRAAPLPSGTRAHASGEPNVFLLPPGAAVSKEHEGRKTYGPAD
jgi:hypothetical protein